MFNQPAHLRGLNNASSFRHYTRILQYTEGMILLTGNDDLGLQWLIWAFVGGLSDKGPFPTLNIFCINLLVVKGILYLLLVIDT